jgi:hypothetical protein
LRHAGLIFVGQLNGGALQAALFLNSLRNSSPSTIAILRTYSGLSTGLLLAWLWPLLRIHSSTSSSELKKIYAVLQIRQFNYICELETKIPLSYLRGGIFYLAEPSFSFYVQDLDSRLFGHLDI